jgi:hypothetical protein
MVRLTLRLPDNRATYGGIIGRSSGPFLRFRFGLKCSAHLASAGDYNGGCHGVRG